MFIGLYGGALFLTRVKTTITAMLYRPVLQQ